MGHPCSKRPSMPLSEYETSDVTHESVRSGPERSVTVIFVSDGFTMGSWGQAYPNSCVCSFCILFHPYWPFIHSFTHSFARLLCARHRSAWERHLHISSGCTVIHPFESLCSSRFKDVRQGFSETWGSQTPLRIRWMLMKFPMGLHRFAFSFCLGGPGGPDQGLREVLSGSFAYETSKSKSCLSSPFVS